MKKIFLPLFALTTILFTSCLDTTQEITLNEDGSGTVSTTNDMGAIIQLARQMGAGEEMEKSGDAKIDSSIALEQVAEEIASLSDEEKAMLKKGTMHVKADVKENIFIAKTSFPFATAMEIAAYNKLTGKMMAEVMKEKAGDKLPAGEMPEVTSIDDYYTLSYSNGELSRKLNTEKYAGAESDEYLKGLKEAGAMGLEMKNTYIINLPRPATMAEGKGVKLSDDKKKVTISVSLDDFFDNPSLLEYVIKY